MIISGTSNTAYVLTAIKKTPCLVSHTADAVRRDALNTTTHNGKGTRTG